MNTDAEDKCGIHVHGRVHIKNACFLYLIRYKHKLEDSEARSLKFDIGTGPTVQNR
jgi:hypothetical protein